MTELRKNGCLHNTVQINQRPKCISCKKEVPFIWIVLNRKIVCDVACVIIFAGNKKNCSDEEAILLGKECENTLVAEIENRRNGWYDVSQEENP